MKRLLLLAGLALALSSPSPAIANSWVRNPADDFDAAKKGLWVVEDATDSLGDPIGVYLSTPFASSPAGGIALISAKCGSRYTSVIVIPEESFISFSDSSTLSAKVDGERHELLVRHEIGWGDTFYFAERGHQLFRRAIREELPVKIAVPLYQEPDVVFEWDMKGGAAAWKEACS